MENYLGRNHNVDCILEMQKLPSESIDCILTDPPYKYLKNQKLEVDFNEQIFFAEAKRVLKKNGFIILFGRGTSFYRWNTILDNLGFTFKEEIIWDKSQNTGPNLPISRIHETISISTKKGQIKKRLFPYTEIKTNRESIATDIKRISSAIKNIKELETIQHYLLTGEVTYQKSFKKNGNGTTVNSLINQKHRGLTTVKSINEGMKCKSIVTELREHYKSIHPTQKPIRLLERLMQLTTEEKDIILDPFSGSCSTLVAARNINRKYIGFEIDKEYYEKGTKRLEESIF